MAKEIKLYLTCKEWDFEGKKGVSKKIEADLGYKMQTLCKGAAYCAEILDVSPAKIEQMKPGEVKEIGKIVLGERF